MNQNQQTMCSQNYFHFLNRKWKEFHFLNRKRKENNKHENDLASPWWPSLTLAAKLFFPFDGHQSLHLGIFTLRGCLGLRPQFQGWELKKKRSQCRLAWMSTNLSCQATQPPWTLHKCTCTANHYPKNVTSLGERTPPRTVDSTDGGRWLLPNNGTIFEREVF